MTDSAFDPRRLRAARQLLAAPPARVDSLTATMAAAAFFALSALGLALTVAMMPTPWTN
jgi:hypothetical protein